MLVRKDRIVTEYTRRRKTLHGTKIALYPIINLPSMSSMSIARVRLVILTLIMSRSQTYRLLFFPKFPKNIPVHLWYSAWFSLVLRKSSSGLTQLKNYSGDTKIPCLSFLLTSSENFICLSFRILILYSEWWRIILTMALQPLTLEHQISAVLQFGLDGREDPM